MKQRYRKLKQKYNDLEKQIAHLHEEKNRIGNQMREVCPHEKLIIVDQDPFLMEMDDGEAEERYKCKDCYRYFTKLELHQI